jgi:large subunit ribosomal protein L31
VKPDIHPKWYPEAKVTCACGNTFTVGATVPAIETEVCYNCHPFFTGEQRIVDTAGQVDRFMRRLEAGSVQRKADLDRQKSREEAERQAMRKRRGLPTTRTKRSSAKPAAAAEPAEAPSDAAEPAEG